MMACSRCLCRIHARCSHSKHASACVRSWEADRLSAWRSVAGDRLRASRRDGAAAKKRENKINKREGRSAEDMRGAKQLRMGQRRATSDDDRQEDEEKKIENQKSI